MGTMFSSVMRAFLEAPRFAVLGTLNPDGSPHLTVVWYEVQGDKILFNTARGRRKERNLQRDPRAALTIEDGNRYLTISGTAGFVDDQATTLEDVRRLAVRYQGEAEGMRLVAEEYSQEERVSIWLQVERVDGFGFDE